jgi:hypothetical protein|tara:strand:+ start:690 stop:908 length:219 start_codon:yes stop_codon:yes gene_type:complete
MAKESLLTEKQAADYLKVTPRYLQYKRMSGGGPQFVKLSHRCVRYTKNALDNHITSNEINSTSALCTNGGIK